MTSLDRDPWMKLTDLSRVGWTNSLTDWKEITGRVNKKRRLTELDLSVYLTRYRTAGWTVVFVDEPNLTWAVTIYDYCVRAEKVFSPWANLKNPSGGWFYLFSSETDAIEAKLIETGQYNG